MKLFYPKIPWKNFEYNKQLLVYTVANNSVVVVELCGRTDLYSDW